MSVQEQLQQMGCIKLYDPSFDILKYLSEFTEALVLYNPLGRRVRFDSLRNAEGVSAQLACPRDNENAYLILDGEVIKGWEACKHCQNALICMTTGATKEFILNQGEQNLSDMFIALDAL